MLSRYWTFREKIRRSQLFQNTVGKAVYIVQILRNSRTGEFRSKVVQAAKGSPRGQGVALCVRIRDEAPNLRELVEYYLAAGVAHLFFYEAKSVDDFHAVLDPFVRSGFVTLIENWPHVPISPAAEHDCVLRCIGRYAWMGCMDADEFVVVEGNVRIDDFFNTLPQRYPALALHWRQFGSNEHVARPSGPVIAEYTRRETLANRHVKVFIRPERVASYRNSHSWYYRGFFSTAMDVNGKRVYSSTSVPPAVERAWINHYHHKSDAEYALKANRTSILDTVGMRFNNRNPERGKDYEQKANEVFDQSALLYHKALCRRQDCSICSAV
jgi:hypothetical protein